MKYFYLLLLGAVCNAQSTPLERATIAIGEHWTELSIQGAPSYRVGTQFRVGSSGGRTEGH